MKNVLTKAENTQREAILAAADEIANRLEKGGAWHIMDTGHMLMFEAVGRTGGMMAIKPIKITCEIQNPVRYRPSPARGIIGYRFHSCVRCVFLPYSHQKRCTFLPLHNSYARGVCGVGLICLAAAKGDSDDALAGIDERTAAVGRADVSVIIGVPQPNRLTVQRFRDFKCMPCASFCSCPMAAFLAASAAASASAWLVNGPSCPLSVLVLALDTS